jgi:hypothetical protein
VNTKPRRKKSLADTHPAIAKEWHPTKNGTLTPHEITAGSNKKVWWLCSKNKSHEWQAPCYDRTGKHKSGCAFCSGRRVHPSNCLANLNPELAKEWHPTKNGKLTPYDVTIGSARRVWWRCLKNPTHEWQAACSNRTGQKQGCPFCANKKADLTNCLASTFPEIAKEWHPTKNGSLTPQQVTPGCDKKVWWLCSNDPSHEWKATCKDRTKKRSLCPFCTQRKVTYSTSLAIKEPDIAREWHPQKNGNLTPYDLVPGSTKKVWWQCRNNPMHEWKVRCIDRTGKRKRGCPYCAGQRVHPSSCLANTNPEIAREWHPQKNGFLTPYDVTAGSGKKVWWRCSKNSTHEWKATCIDRTGKRKRGCPYCNSGWTKDAIRLFISTLLTNIDTLTPAGLYVLFQQTGILNCDGSGKSFIQALKTGRFPKEELEKFVNQEASLVEDFLVDPEHRLEAEALIAVENNVSENDLVINQDGLRITETKDILQALDNKVFSNLDKEVVDFFIKEAAARIWQHAFLDEKKAKAQLQQYNDGGLYAEKVKLLFLQDFETTKTLEIPDGYDFHIDGKLCPPNLMQRYTAFMIQKTKRFGNWSGTGSGKTLSAILASRIIDAALTIICCPNSVVEGWEKNIKQIYPDSIVITKDTKLNIVPNRHHYMVLNYEFFQQPHAEKALKKLLNNKVDLIVIDEIHYSKQRVAEDMSKRRQVITAMLTEAAVVKEGLHVLGMSATPVINNLFEGKTLIELVTGLHHNDLNTKPTISNCIALYQKFVSHGIRWIPRYNQSLNIKSIEIDGSHLLGEIRGLKSMHLGGSVVDLESVLTKAKIPEIINHLKPKTIVYTYYVKNILAPLQEAIEKAGWKTAIYSGENKTGLEEFLHGKADVLIATSCIGTGVDGLQGVCNRIIVNTLPWTHAEFEQLKGRIYRQGQKSNNVDIIVPLTYMTVNGKRWSWCIDSRWKRIQFKKSIADAAVDGVIPEGHLRTPAQALRDATLWLERLERGEVYEIERRTISIPLANDIKIDVRKKIGDLTKMNSWLNHTRSDQVHQHFQKNPVEWESYHSIYREERKNWSVVPYKEAIKWCKSRPHMIIGDFGCGEALLRQELANQVHSFDHVAINDNVIACNMTHVPLDDDSLDAAIFSLSLMGSDYIDYLREAHRCLKLDGHLWIAEPTSRIKDINLFKELLERLGFDVRRTHEKWKFTFIEALKSDREINEVALALISPNILD